jgi:hypothetical protein
VDARVLEFVRKLFPVVVAFCTVELAVKDWNVVVVVADMFPVVVAAMEDEVKLPVAVAV